jgi:hypothetical protein
MVYIVEVIIGITDFSRFCMDVQDFVLLVLWKDSYNLTFRLIRLGLYSILSIFGGLIGQF